MISCPLLGVLLLPLEAPKESYKWGLEGAGIAQLESCYGSQALSSGEGRVCGTGSLSLTDRREENSVSQARGREPGVYTLFPGWETPEGGGAWAGAQDKAAETLEQGKATIRPD